MVFSSSTFLMAFLPLTLLLYYGVGVALTKNVTVKNCILLLASLVFYAWGEPVYIVLMLLSILFNFAAGRVIDSALSDGRTGLAKFQFIADVVYNLAVLGFFKYADFVVDNINGLFGVHIPPLELPLPIGISFYTFQILSYIIDLYTGKIRVQKNLVSFALYISLFPQLIAGPIVKYKEIEEQLVGRKESLVKYSRGMARFVVGLAKKLLLANTLGAVYSGIQAMDVGSLSALTAWTGIACYTLQIYFDFSGYSDMAIGLGSMFGFRFNENFNYPYIATSITDFWRRWHISLSSWFRDYVYIPLGGNRRKTPRVIFNLIVVWLLTGLWHGAAWNFVLWGMFYGVLLIFEKYVLGDLLPRIAPHPDPRPLAHDHGPRHVRLGAVLGPRPHRRAPVLQGHVRRRGGLYRRERRVPAVHEPRGAGARRVLRDARVSPHPRARRPEVGEPGEVRRLPPAVRPLRGLHGQ